MDIKNVKHLVTHKNCPDGVSSAMIVKQALPEAKITFIQHNTPEHIELVPEEGMLFCDITPHHSNVKKFVSAGAIVLDHHKFAKDIIEQFGPNGIFADEDAEPGVSGATLALRHVYNTMKVGRPTPPWIARLALLAGVRDTWQKEHKQWREACEQSWALTFYPPDVLVNAHPREWRRLIDVPGKILYEKNMVEAQNITDDSHRFVSDVGTRVLIFPGSSMTSDVAEVADTSVDLVAGFTYKNQLDGPYIIFSLRSHTNFNCGDFCKKHGGGGHTKAAGFNVKLDVESDLNPFKHFRTILNEHEAGHY